MGCQGDGVGAGSLRAHRLREGCVQCNATIIPGLLPTHHSTRPDQSPKANRRGANNGAVAPPPTAKDASGKPLAPFAVSTREVSAKQIEDFYRVGGSFRQSPPTRDNMKVMIGADPDADITKGFRVIRTLR